MAKIQADYGIITWLADPSGKQQIQALRGMGFKVQNARHGNKIALRTQLVGARLNIDPASKLPGLYMTSECPNLISELEALSWRRTKIKGEADEVMNDAFERGDEDHAFDALANVLAEYDAVRMPIERQREPVSVYGEL